MIMRIQKPGYYVESIEHLKDHHLSYLQYAFKSAAKNITMSEYQVFQRLSLITDSRENYQTFTLLYTDVIRFEE